MCTQGKILARQYLISLYLLGNIGHESYYERKYLLLLNTVDRKS